MDSQEAASMTALILNGVSKERAAARWSQDPEFDQLWDDISADIDKQRQENPKVQFAIPNEMPDLSGGDDAPEGDNPPAPDDGKDPEKAPTKTAPAAPISGGGPAVASLKKKAAPPK